MNITKLKINLQKSFTNKQTGEANKSVLKSYVPIEFKFRHDAFDL